MGHEELHILTIGLVAFWVILRIRRRRREREAEKPTPGQPRERTP